MGQDLDCDVVVVHIGQTVLAERVEAVHDGFGEGRRLRLTVVRGRRLREQARILEVFLEGDERQHVDEGDSDASALGGDGNLRKTCKRVEVQQEWRVEEVEEEERGRYKRRKETRGERSE